MKTYYCVLNAFDDKGNVTAAVVDIVKAEKRPESKFVHTIRKDIYTDWFDSKPEAENYVSEILNNKLL